MTSNLAVVKKPGAEMSQVHQAPAWLAAQMPGVYRSRFEEIQRLAAEIQGMERMGRLLWEHGPALREVVSEAFAALNTKSEWSTDGSHLTVRIDATRRLLVHVATTDGPHERNSDSLANAFKLLQTTAAADDRVVLVTTGERTMPPQERADTVSPDAHDLLKRMGVNVMPCTTLFSIWMLSLQGLSEARAYLELLHSQDGGTFKTKAGK